MAATQVPLGIVLNVPPTVVPGQPMTVTLNGSGTFTGLVLMAENQGQRVGSFSVGPVYHSIACSGSAGGTITHSSAAAKALPASFTWTAPANATGVTFRGVVLRSSPQLQFQMLTPVTATAPAVPSTFAPLTVVLLLALGVAGVASAWGTNKAARRA